MRLKAKLAVGAALVTAGAGLLVPISPAEAVSPPPITWGGCGDAFLRSIGAQCSSVSVPLDYAHPTGTKIKLAVSRVRHTVPASKYQGVMLVNPGGPGGGGLELASLGSAVPKGAGNAYDWIGFDPRGVGHSTPALRCNRNFFAAGTRPVDSTPTTPALETAWLAKVKGYATSCGTSTARALLSHMTTIDWSRDMEQIRLALRAPRINYYGFSYGTYLGQVYATMYPTHVRRMVLDGNVDPRTVWYKANLDQDPAFEGNFNRWTAWVAKNDATYHLGTTAAAVKSAWYAQRATLVATPAGKIAGTEWTELFVSVGYSQFAWARKAKLWQDYRANHSAAALLTAYNAAQGVGDDNLQAVYNAVECTDAPWTRNWATWRADNNRVAATAPWLTWDNAWLNAPCAFWPVKSRTVAPTVNGSKAPAILLVNETLDAATPYSGSLIVRGRFPRSRLIAVNGGVNHANSLNGNLCVDNRIANYLLTGALPARVAGSKADVLCAPMAAPSAALAVAAPNGVAAGVH